MAHVASPSAGMVEVPGGVYTIYLPHNHPPWDGPEEVYLPRFWLEPAAHKMMNEPEAPFRRATWQELAVAISAGLASMAPGPEWTSSIVIPEDTDALEQTRGVGFYAVQWVLPAPRPRPPRKRDMGSRLLRRPMRRSSTVQYRFLRERGGIPALVSPFQDWSVGFGRRVLCEVPTDARRSSVVHSVEIRRGRGDRWPPATVFRALVEDFPAQDAVHLLHPGQQVLVLHASSGWAYVTNALDPTQGLGWVPQFALSGPSGMRR